MNVSIVVKNTDSTQLSETNILSFTFIKDIYTPYTYLRAKVASSAQSFLNASEVLLYIDNTLIHHGLADRILYSFENGQSTATLISKGFTSLLMQNQTEPGLKTNISVNSLMESFYTFPYITHEDNSQTSYIYVNNNSTMWEGIENLAYKISGTYPHIRGTNCVRITPVQNPSVFSYNVQNCLSYGNEINSKRLFSNFHMADINGDFGEYDYQNSEAVSMNIIRHRFFELDMQFLYNPQQALEYRDKYCSRGERRIFASYCGYSGEDLYDTVSFGSIVSKPVSRVKVTGDSTGIVTEISVYSDKFIQ